jgi:hypothetical protein
MAGVTKKTKPGAIRKGMPDIISRLPRRFGLNREEWGAEIDRELIKVWKEKSGVAPSRVDAIYRAVREKRSCPISKLPSEAEFATLDEIIVAQAVTLGWRMAASELILFRFSQWSEHPFRPAMFERIGKAWAQSVRILARGELPPIDDPGLREYKRIAVPELRVLLREMRAIFSLRSPSPSSEEIAEWFIRALAYPEKFPMLASNFFHWGTFLQAPENVDVLTCQLAGRQEPAAIFDTWFSWSKGHTPDYLRKRLTRRPAD